MKENSMEEDIKILEDKLKLNATTKFDWFGEKEFQALGNIINRYKKLKEENRIFELEGSRVRLKIHIDKNYIPVSLVEEMIEELEDAKKFIDKENWKYIYQMQINILQELLEKR